jgi:hypothetical protein
MARNDHKRNPEESSFQGAAVDMVVATLHDSTNEAGGVSRGLYIDATGTITFVTDKDTVVALAGLAVGVVHPIRVKRVNNTGTTIAAADIFLVY